MKEKKLIKKSFTILDLPKGERPREKLAKFGPESLSIQELLALILERGIAGKSVMSITQQLLNTFGNIKAISEASLEELAKIRGIGLAKAAQIKACFELAKRKELGENVSKKQSNLGIQKLLGAFYTPEKTVKYMVKKLGKIEKSAKILEPCGGDGVFVRELLRQGINPKQITVWDIDPAVKENMEKLGVHFKCGDTLLRPMDGSQPLFDFVISNPPYLSKGSTYVKKNKHILQRIYKEIGCHDTYAMFMYNGLQHLVERGTLCFIVSDTFLALKVHQKLRECILKNTKIREILLAPKNLFNSIGSNVNTCIITLEKCPGDKNKKNRNENVIRFVNRVENEDEYFNPKEIFEIPQRFYFELEGFPFVIKIHPTILNLFKNTPKITEVIKGHIGMHTHNNREYLGAIKDTRLAEKYAKKNKKLKKYEPPYKIVDPKEIIEEKWRLYIRQGGTNQYFSEIEECVAWNENSKSHYDIPQKNLFFKEGLIISGISSRFSARYMPKGCLWDTNKAIGFIVTDSKLSINYLLGVLNSKLYNYLVKGILNTTSSVQINDIRKLPFVYPTEEQKNKIEKLVEKIIQEEKNNPKYDYSLEQNQIDEIVFKIYKLPRSVQNYIISNY